MIIGKVIGNVWATKKEDSLSGLKLMIVRRENFCDRQDSPFVAVDVVGAGIGEQVLITRGSSAHKALGRTDIPIDAVIVGIIDSLEIEHDRKDI
ncbi:MAG: EutN/CcmL family microcompartment protein [Clostridiales bacterium]|jgi:ethanolamine utilization protein EutN|nr:EutN/CcmL family microcompartment protein [Clostridiales bacterium]